MDPVARVRRGAAPSKRDVESLGRSLWRLLPAAPQRLSLGNKRALEDDLNSIFHKYAPSSKKFLASFFDDYASLINAEGRAPVLSNFLVYANSVHEGERLGSYMFLFKVPSAESEVDVLLTPVSLYLLGGGGPDLQPDLHRFAQLWYGTACGLRDMLPDFERLVEESSVHRRLVPVGPLVVNGGSTFINKLTTVCRGPSRVRDPRSGDTYVPLRLPLETF